MNVEEEIVKDLNCEELYILDQKQRMGSKSRTKKIKELIKKQMSIKLCPPKNLIGF